MKKQIITLVIALLCTTVTSFAQLTEVEKFQKNLSNTNIDTVAWMHSGTLNIGCNQGFLHNWAAGGELSSITLSGLFSGNLTRYMHKHIWSNNLDLSYGLFYAYSNSFVPRKLDDRIDFTSKYGYKIKPNKDFYFTALANFKTQFTRGFDYAATNWTNKPTSNFLSPGYVTLALGFEYRKGSQITFFLSPLAARMTLASTEFTKLLPTGEFCIEYGKTRRTELGAYFSGRYVKELSKNIIYKTRVDFYTNYLAKNTVGENGLIIKKDNPGNIDWLWDNLLTFKASKLINVSLATTLIYDNDIPYAPANDATTEPGNGLGWWQMKQIFTIGFQYKFK